MRAFWHPGVQPTNGKEAHLLRRDEWRLRWEICAKIDWVHMTLELKLFSHPRHAEICAFSHVLGRARGGMLTKKYAIGIKGPLFTPPFAYGGVAPLE